jgi:hypothetical protein
MITSATLEEYKSIYNISNNRNQKYLKYISTIISLDPPSPSLIHSPVYISSDPPSYYYSKIFIIIKDNGADASSTPSSRNTPHPFKSKKICSIFLQKILIKEEIPPLSILWSGPKS